MNDPHFMITDAVTKQHLCFDYVGHDGDFIQLVADAENSKYAKRQLFYFYNESSLNT